jgi:hypothetical protein
VFDPVLVGVACTMPAATVSRNITLVRGRDNRAGTGGSGKALETLQQVLGQIEATVEFVGRVGKVRTQSIAFRPLSIVAMVDVPLTHVFRKQYAVVGLALRNHAWHCEGHCTSIAKHCAWLGKLSIMVICNAWHSKSLCGLTRGPEGAQA